MKKWIKDLIGCSPYLFLRIKEDYIYYRFFIMGQTWFILGYNEGWYD
jgi:hypothetical protein